MSNFFEESRNEPVAESFLQCLVLAANADGNASDEEIDSYVKYVFKRSLFNGLDIREILTRTVIMIHSVDDKDSLLKISASQITEEWKATLFSLCCDLIFADSLVGASEKKFLLDLRQYLQLPDSTVNKIIEVFQIMYKGKL